jgi:hypothetical protein
MDIFTNYATDEALELGGAPAVIDGAGFTLARLGNRKYARLLAKQIEANSVVLDQRDTDEEAAAAQAMSDQIMAKVLAATILLGWGEGISYKGQPLPYSTENAELVLSHKDFRAKVMAKAGEIDAYRAKLEAATGNA